MSSFSASNLMIENIRHNFPTVNNDFTNSPITTA